MSYGSLLTEPRFEKWPFHGKDSNLQATVVWLPFVIIVPQIVQIPLS
jgi:hypothetical protein